MIKFMALACASSFACSTAMAQVVMPATTAPVATPVYNSAVMRTGTEVPLRLSEELTTKGKKLKVGQRFHMEVAENVSLQNQVVIPAGSPAVGEITEVRNKGMWGKSGHLTARIMYVTVNGRQIRLSGGFDDKGVTGTAGVVGALAVVPVAGFFMTGTSAKIPLGFPVKGFVDEDVPLTMAAAGPVPLIVGSPTAQPAVQMAPVAKPVLTPVAEIKSR
ncbi:hypothetical protein [Sphingomonas sp. Mn802worker]|uniref:hypothetical protein n=1 Tax=Sphingomonas sp. Mn802worker TaxID=629773 RepID=UPI0003811E8B|nr:hypothetical protein [Sphingomonas sp. Mn802worker]